MNYAQLNKRIFAALFDFFTIVIFSAFLSLYLLMFNFNSDYFIDMQKFTNWAMSDSFFKSNATFILANIIFMLTTFSFWFFSNGSTIGQKIFKLRVVDISGNKLGLKQSLYRSFVYILFYNIPIFHIISFILIYTKKRALHDIIAKTKVISLV
jgi:uncharacterized RDD family membrane protein YckC